MLKRLSPQTRISLRELARRIDKVAADLNILLVVFALGLAVLDMTFLVTQDVIDHLPPLTRVTADAPNAN